jgi:NAD+ diphosphatase
MNNNLPKSFCPKCGEENKPKADNLLVCTNEHQTFVNPVVGAVVFITKENKVLYGVRSIEPNKGRLSAPGGFVELYESAEQTAIREAKEEMGADIAIMDILGTYSVSYGARNILNVVFVAEYIGGEITPADDMNGGEPKWIPIDQLPSLDELAWDWYLLAQDDLKKWYSKNNR